VNRRTPLVGLGVLLALYLALPLAALAERLATGHVSGFGAPGMVSAVVVSAAGATITTALCALLGVPLAHALAVSERRLARAVRAVVMLPLALPPLMGGVLLVWVVGPGTALGRLFGGRLTDSLAGLVLAQLFVSAPFTVVSARSAFAALDPALFDVAATLGMRRWTRLARVVLPAAAGGIGAGLLLTWLRAFGEFGATVIVAYHPTSLPVFTYERFGAGGVDQALAPTAVAVAAAVGALAVPTVLRRVGHRRAPAAAFPRRSGPAAPQSVYSATGGAPPLRFAVEHRLGDFALRAVHEGSSPRLAVVGPSGAGKSTLLRCLAGLHGPGGDVTLGARSIAAIAVEDRRIGYLPQASCLVPHRSVWDQVVLGPRADAALAAWWIARLGLRGLEGRFPGELSGGEVRRVALARALCGSPELVLLDEPLAALETPVRAELRGVLRAAMRAGDFASVVVTHDPQEAAMLGEEIAVVQGGRIVQAGPCAEVFRQPATASIARLLGIDNVFPGRIEGDGRVRTGGLTLRARAAGSLPVGTHVLWSVRPEYVELHSPHHGAAVGAHPARVGDAIDLGSTTEVHVVVEGLVTLVIRTTARAVPKPESAALVTLPVDHVRVWPLGCGEGATPFQRAARRQVPERPPAFSHSASSPMVMERSTDLHMS
jgi:molybdate transport system permease protein